MIVLKGDSHLQPKYVFVVDTRNSALWRAAIAHSRNGNCAVIAATDYFSPWTLARDIAEESPQFVIFSWRPAFDSIVSASFPKNVIKSTGAILLLLVPDHAGLDLNRQEEQLRILLSDGLLVTSEILRKEYLKHFLVENIQLLHDLPDFEVIDEINAQKSFTRSNKIIWVGNSRWGERLGYKDHKGLIRFALPAFRALAKLDNSLSFEVIDSSKLKKEYKEVLESIRSSACLIVTSDSEGTCLPLIEACALGTPVVTFDVGIARELLSNNLQFLISTRDLSSLVTLIFSALSNNDTISERIALRASVYRESVVTDLQNLEFSRVPRGVWREYEQKLFIRNFFYWKLRWSKNVYFRFFSRLSH
jgi:hypothetical protein